MSNNKNEMSEEDYLKRHLQDLDQGQKEASGEIPFVENPQVNRTSDLQYFNMDIRELPCGQFYPTGTLFMVRPAQVREIQSYAMVDDNNFYDIVEKMNDMLQACVRIKFPDGKAAAIPMFMFLRTIIFVPLTDTFTIGKSFNALVTASTKIGVYVIFSPSFFSNSFLTFSLQSTIFVTSASTNEVT